MKKILVVFFNNGDIKNRVEGEAMWNHLVQEYGLAKTREIVIPSKRMVEFEDGTIIELLPIENTRGVRASHVYASDSLQGELLTIAQMAVLGSTTERFDTEGKSASERFKTFGIHNGKLITQ